MKWSNSYSDEVIEKIKELYNELKSSYKVAEILGVSPSTVKRHANLKWKSKSKTTAESVSDWRRRIKQKLVDYKGGKCCKCGYNKCIKALEFHHLNQNEKDFGISGKCYSYEKLKAEADKCILVCSNCHVEIHEGILEI